MSIILQLDNFQAWDWNMMMFDVSEVAHDIQVQIYHPFRSDTTGANIYFLAWLSNLFFNLKKYSQANVSQKNKMFYLYFMCRWTYLNRWTYLIAQWKKSKYILRIIGNLFLTQHNISQGFLHILFDQSGIKSKVLDNNAFVFFNHPHGFQN